MVEEPEQRSTTRHKWKKRIHPVNHRDKYLRGNRSRSRPRVAQHLDLHRAIVNTESWSSYVAFYSSLGIDILLLCVALGNASSCRSKALYKCVRRIATFLGSEWYFLSFSGSTWLETELLCRSQLSTGLSTLPYNRGDSRVWTVFSSLLSRVWNLPDNRRILSFFVIQYSVILHVKG